MSPAKLNTDILKISRLPEYSRIYPEIKDPCIIALSDGTYLLYSSIGDSKRQNWIVGRFSSPHPNGPWTELPPVIFENLSGAQLCAPGVLFENGLFTMYIQTACFETDGIIAQAVSSDGQRFINTQTSLVTKSTITTDGHEVIGVYDAGISEMNLGGVPHHCLVFSGYRQIGSGDLYMTLKKAGDSAWPSAKKIMAQEEVPFHNHPLYANYEWGLEGAKIIQISSGLFLLVGVCFLPRSHEYAGSRQRIFFAVSRSIEGPFTPLGLPFGPQKKANALGEIGHPDISMLENKLWIVYQEHEGNNQPWFLRSAFLPLDDLLTIAEMKLHEAEINKSYVANDHLSEILPEHEHYLFL